MCFKLPTQLFQQKKLNWHHCARIVPDGLSRSIAMGKTRCQRPLRIDWFITVVGLLPPPACRARSLVVEYGNEAKFLFPSLVEFFSQLPFLFDDGYRDDHRINIISGCQLSLQHEHSIALSQGRITPKAHSSASFGLLTSGLIRLAMLSALIENNVSSLASRYASERVIATDGSVDPKLDPVLLTIASITAARLSYHADLTPLLSFVQFTKAKCASNPNLPQES